MEIAYDMCDIGSAFWSPLERVEMDPVYNSQHSAFTTLPKLECKLLLHNDFLRPRISQSVVHIFYNITVSQILQYRTRHQAQSWQCQPHSIATHFMQNRDLYQRSYTYIQEPVTGVNQRKIENFRNNARCLRSRLTSRPSKRARDTWSKKYHANTLCIHDSSNIGHSFTVFLKL